MPTRKYFYKSKSVKSKCGRHEFQIVSTCGEWDIELDSAPVTHQTQISMIDASMKLCLPFIGWKMVAPFLDGGRTRELMFLRGHRSDDVVDVVTPERFISFAANITETLFFPSWTRNIANPRYPRKNGGHAVVTMAEAVAIKCYDSAYSEYAKNEIGALQYLKLRVKSTDAAHLISIGRSAHITPPESKGVYAFEMTAVEGGYDLGEFIEKRANAYDLGARVEFAKFVARDITRALAIIHSCGMVHGDLKPENIIYGFTPTAKDEGFYLVDFGMACIENTHFRIPPCGTPGYAAPEISLGGLSSHIQTPTCALDIWALGIVLIEIVFCARPFNFSPVCQVPIVANDGEKRLDETFFGNALRGMSLFGVGKSRGVFAEKVFDIVKESFPEPATPDELIERLVGPGVGVCSDFASFVFSCVKFDPEARASAASLSSHLFVRDK